MKRSLLTLAAVVSAAVIAVALVLALTQSPPPARSQGRALATPVVPASLVQVRKFGANPGKLRMYLYVPRSVRPDPAILDPDVFAAGAIFMGVPFGCDVACATIPTTFPPRQTPLATDHPQPGWTRTEYGTGANHVQVEAYSISGVGHYLPEAGMEVYVIRFFGLDR